MFKSISDSRIVFRSRADIAIWAQCVRLILGAENIMQGALGRYNTRIGAKGFFIVNFGVARCEDDSPDSSVGLGGANFISADAGAINANSNTFALFGRSITPANSEAAFLIACNGFAALDGLLVVNNCNLNGEKKAIAGYAYVNSIKTLKLCFCQKSVYEISYHLHGKVVVNLGISKLKQKFLTSGTNDNVVTDVPFQKIKSSYVELAHKIIISFANVVITAARQSYFFKQECKLKAAVKPYSVHSQVEDRVHSTSFFCSCSHNGSTRFRAKFQPPQL